MTNRLPQLRVLGVFALSILAACSGARDNQDTLVETSSHPSAGPRPLHAIVASVNEELGLPTFMWLGSGARENANTPVVDVARETVRHLAPRFQLTAKRVEDTVVLRGVESIGEGAFVARFSQHVGGVEIFRAGINVALTKDHAPVAATGTLSPHVTPKRGGAFARDARASGAKAVSKVLGSDIEAGDLHEDGNASSSAVYTHFTGRSSSGARFAVRAKRVWFPTANAILAAHYVEVERSSAGSADTDLTGFVISADSGAVLFENSMVAADSYTYRAWVDPVSKVPLPSPYGRSPFPYPIASTTGFAASFVAPSLVTIENLPFSQNDPWLPPGATATTGNNVDAYADLAVEDGFGTGDVRAFATAAGSFDRTFRPTGAPTVNADAQQAIVTHLFYVVNYMHDLFYDAGFDESAGNAQASNFGRGGKEGDPIRAEAQDFSGANNANMSTPADGTSPRMQMYLFSGSPARDGSLDATVVAHEWGHYLSNRLVGDASGLSTAQARGMGEGWGDFTALLALSRAEDGAVATNAGWRGAFAVGSYASNGGHYFGMRRYPYSTDMSKNPLTLRHIQNGTRLPTTAPVAFGSSGINNAETHNTGEVWATMLWECYAALLRDSRYTHAQASERMRRYLVASLKLTPSAPTFLEARDAVLAAAYATNQKDFELFAGAFAKRGAGLRAKAPDRNADGNLGVVESMSSGNDLEIVSVNVDDGVRSCDNDGFLDGNEEGNVTVVVRNTGNGTLNALTGSITSTTRGVTIAGAGTVSVPTLLPFETATVSVGVSLGSASSLLPISFNVTMSEPSLTITRDVTTTFLGTGNRDDLAASTSVDTFEAMITPWTMSGDPALDGALPWRLHAGTESPPNHVFYIPANEAISDQYLVSPVLSASTAAALKLTFRQRHFFETTDGKNYDGAVVEISIDDGATWTDVGSSLYGGTIEAGTTVAPSVNPLKGRRGLVGKSAGFPAFASVALDLGRTYAGKNVRIRFRVGTDEGTSTHGWELDDLAVSGITNTPFPSQVADTCTP